MRSISIRILTLLLLTRGVAAAQEAAPLPGFAPDRAAAEREREARFDATLDADRLRGWIERLAAHPHHVGSPWGKQNAEFIAERFKEWGFDTRIETFQVLFPTPRTRRLELLGPHPYVAKLSEPPLPDDPTSSQQNEQLPTYNAYSVDGDVEGDLVYVHYGRPEEYEQLQRLGVDVKGKIVLARYGGSWRGIKPKVAAEHGAIGCILYSDPRDDGYFEGDVYPKGAFKSDRGVQRGSVMDMPLYPGDPLTPGHGSVPGAERLARADATTLTHIPVLPISYSDAQPLLAALDGPVAPESWRGALPLTYHVGPGPARVHLQLAFDWNIVPANDVIATLKGAERPDQWILRGNHHDAWVNGADDPVSGMAALLEEAHAIGELAKKGWRPKRTIVYAAWDAEEPGLIGSTEWVETHAAELRRNAAVYINTDSNGRGFLGAGGSPTLERFFDAVAHDVIDPETGISVAERARARRLTHAPAPAPDAPPPPAGVTLSPLGSGSDYTPFLQHLGIASLNLGYGGENAGGEYHSIYDSIAHYARFGDPGYQYGLALARTTGRTVLRLADADLLPMEFSALSGDIEKWIRELVELSDGMRTEADRVNRMIDERLYEAAADPRAPVLAPPRKAEVPHLNFAPLQNSLETLKRAAQKYDEALRAEEGNLGAWPAAKLRALEGVLTGIERAMTSEAGLPLRPWFKHQLYAPGFYTGYGVKTLPAVREAIEQEQWGDVDRRIADVTGTLERGAAEIEKAAGMLGAGPG